MTPELIDHFFDDVYWFIVSIVFLCWIMGVCSTVTEICANRKKNTACDRRATPGHIYCKPCRLATGGYDRYNPPAAKPGTQNSSNKQE